MENNIVWLICDINDFLFSKEGTLYLAIRDGVFKSPDKGKHLQRISNPAPVPSTHKSACCD